MIALTMVIGGLVFFGFLVNLWIFQRATRHDTLSPSAHSPESRLARRYAGVYVQRPETWSARPARNRRYVPVAAMAAEDLGCGRSGG
ncbi:MAG: hypothetical protein JWO67_4187 [Streptosporangiaceae bacterium]|jgi:hypothetical protein|nr:hypothetical protein [Streptosporangiaceae bacterium]